jgi:hypothetical protein
MLSIRFAVALVILLVLLGAVCVGDSEVFSDTLTHFAAKELVVGLKTGVTLINALTKAAVSSLCSVAEGTPDDLT